MTDTFFGSAATWPLPRFLPTGGLTLNDRFLARTEGVGERRLSNMERDVVSSPCRSPLLDSRQLEYVALEEDLLAAIDGSRD